MYYDLLNAEFLGIKDVPHDRMCLYYPVPILTGGCVYTLALLIV